MSSPIITLTTDFGHSSPYAAAMKGVILAINPNASIVDLSHQVPPQDRIHGAFFLAEALPFFPPEAVHVAVIDPGVGTNRAVLYVELEGCRLLAPDNGIWRLAAQRLPLRRIIRLENRRWWRNEVSATFHGRDIFAPVAAYLSKNLDPVELGPVTQDYVDLPLPSATRTATGIEGVIVFVDDFGNLISNIPGAWLRDFPRREVQLGPHRINRWVRTFGDGEFGEVVALESSGGWVEIAEVKGNASRRLSCVRGDPVSLRFSPNVNCDS